MGDNWGGDVVMDFAASPNTQEKNDAGEKTKTSEVFIDGASVWYQHSDALRIDLGQKESAIWTSKRRHRPQNSKQSKGQQ